MRRGSRRLRKMKGRGLMNTMRNKLKLSNETKKTMSEALYAVTPSQAKQNWMKNKAGKAANYSMKAAKGVGKGAYGLGKGILKSPIILGNLLAEATK